ncbi:glycosyltransferase family 2 protein [Candidatus Woesebacteria bacterium]|nr:MAG: glycosyltransferase family 2 protein [Candidatus Woesebacteria bacterium]
MYKGKTVSLVLATYREKKTIRRVIESFQKTQFVDEIIVVNNNAQKGTDQEVNKTGVKIVYEDRQGYGYAFQKGLNTARGDLIVACEPDGSFLAKDLERLLVYSNDFEVVLGSRTSLISSLSGAGMGVFRKFANVIEAKTIEVLFNTNALTDVGCTYKLFSRKALNILKRKWGFEKSPLFNTQLTLLTVSNKLSFVEVPVTYLQRVGESAIVGNYLQTVKWAIFIQTYILVFWTRYISKKLHT